MVVGSVGDCCGALIGLCCNARIRFGIVVCSAGIRGAGSVDGNGDGVGLVAGGIAVGACSVGQNLCVGLGVSLRGIISLGDGG